MVGSLVHGEPRGSGRRDPARQRRGSMLGHQAGGNRGHGAPLGGYGSLRGEDQARLALGPGRALRTFGSGLSLWSGGASGALRASWSGRAGRALSPFACSNGQGREGREAERPNPPLPSVQKFPHGQPPYRFPVLGGGGGKDSTGRGGGFSGWMAPQGGRGGDPPGQAERTRCGGEVLRPRVPSYPQPVFSPPALLRPSLSSVPRSCGLPTSASVIACPLSSRRSRATDSSACLMPSSI